MNFNGLSISGFRIILSLFAGLLVVAIGCASPHLGRSEATAAFNGARLVSVVDPTPEIRLVHDKK